MEDFAETHQVHRGARLLLAGGILLGGIAAASLFRRPPPDAPHAGLPDRGGYRQGNQVSPTQAELVAPSRFGAAMDSPVVAKGGEPDLGKDYPSRDAAVGIRWGVSMGIGKPNGDRLDTSVRIHRIADGDTLRSLAERYLGDARRSDEIFQANRDALTSPEALPLGVELRIPPRYAPAGSPAPQTTPRP